MEFRSSKTLDLYPLSAKKPLKKTISFMIGWAILLGILTVAGFTAIVARFGFSLGRLSAGAMILIGVFVLSAFLYYQYQRWYLKTYFYNLTDDYVIIRKGPIAPHEITIPYERIQDVYVDQDVLDRIFGLYDVHLSTATISSGYEAHIDGVGREAAEGLRRILLEKVREKIVTRKA